MVKVELVLSHKCYTPRPPDGISTHNRLLPTLFSLKPNRHGLGARKAILSIAKCP